MDDIPTMLGATITAGLLAIASPVSAQGVDDAVLDLLDTCLNATALERDVQNTSVMCFNDARTACADADLACEAGLTGALEERAGLLLARLPGELESAPEFAKDRYQEILVTVEDGAEKLCKDVAENEAVSCAYRAQALRLAKLRSLASQVDPRLLAP